MHLRIPVGPRDHVRGDLHAPIVLVEYGDFECPSCGAARALVETLCDELGDRLAFVYRHFPLPDIHPFAEIAAEASEAAAAHGRFWELHDILFANQDALQPDDLIAYAEALDLDTAQFTDDLAGHVYRAHVQQDVAGGARSGVLGTPTFFINALRYDGPPELEPMLDVMERAMQVH